MRYFVIGANGELFGPADIPTLNQWITEGRLMPTSMLQEELGGARFAASMLPQLAFSASYPRGGVPSPYAADNGASEIKNAWIYGIIGFFCFGIVLGPVGLAYALKAKQKGHPQAVGAVVLCSIVTVFAILGIILFLTGNNPLQRMFR